MSEVTEADAREHLADLDARAARGPLSPENEHVRVQLRDALDESTPTGTGEAVDWRKELWLGHGCPLPALYGDDGEMQCCECILDFKRDTPELIARRWAERLHSAREEAGRLGRERDEAGDVIEALTDTLGVKAWVLPELVRTMRDTLAARDAELAGVREASAEDRELLEHVMSALGWDREHLRAWYRAARRTAQEAPHA